MHQHPRSPFPARQPSVSSPSSARGDGSRDPDDNRASSMQSSDTTRGLGIDSGADAPAPGKEAMAKLNQIIANYHTKAALIILHARADLPQSFSKGSDSPRVNRWFNVDLDETDEYRDSIRRWRTCDAADNRPPPMIIETYLDAKSLTNSQTLVLIDENGKRWDVVGALAASQNALVRAKPKEVVLERWRVELGPSSTRPPPDLASILPTVYKKSIVLFRSLHAYARLLPAWKVVKRAGIMRTNPALRVRYRIREARDSDLSSSSDSLTLSLQSGTEKVVDTYSFGTTESPAGPFSVQVTYRLNVDFRVDDSESLLSSRFMGADDNYFLPSLPSEEPSKMLAQEAGSLPLGRRGLADPDRSQAYGSLSTFHQVGPTTGASPISTLRAVRDMGSPSPSSASPPRKLLSAAKVGPVGRVVGESSGVARRPSISIQPFKAPPLSASPSLVDPPLGVSPRASTGRAITPSSLSDSRTMPPPSVPASAGRKIGFEPALPSSASSSPKPAPISRYSSSFSHRRGRLSSGGTTRIEEDNISSGKASAASSGAPPGSGILADPNGASGDSLHTDDENISDFLKMLDLRKDLLSPVKAAAVDAATRRTSAALTRFQRMRDTNAALSDSMSSSFHLHRSSSSSSRQLSSVPPMVAGTSISTASSPGKPISPHTPHTPAIRSRLSSNNNIITNDREPDASPRQSDVEPEVTPSDETTYQPTQPGANVIDIPTSPSSGLPTYRRATSAHSRRISAGGGDDEEIFPFGMRSVSLGDDRTHLSLSARMRQHEYESMGTNTAQPSSGTTQPADDTSNPALQTSYPFREFNTQRGGCGSSAAVATSTSSNHPYQTRFSHSRGRGSSGGPQSHSSTSGSLPRGSAIPAHLTERERDRDGSASGSNSVASSLIENRRGASRRSGSGRSLAQHTTSFDEEEPLLFAMSDFGASRRSLEEGRRSSVGGESGTASGGSRRGSGRRGAGMPGFHPWQ
ncbi:autophagy protein Atg13, putative [Talaromyces stipitatus ATCC 10500]|uniref:Autophagy-related protein 13 n=1 Tax=Talaromyces stipitatus (strain ATCC 10500 / CBS 375.48 / QM 6759 / NRRL 1006) TaxID=441959 RepID=B8LYK9_TALSN|nr:autophagy protein Atg13, putative [Talaromyces stipitatus ATCC 10500]EED23367.1 autophagy protein Atg13, putative [Talaromyces stipitatus ATCC 10500]